MAGNIPEVVLDSTALDELNGAESKTLLDTIDSLRALNVGDIVHLPQIIVVGDQSSGKSSVLEAISHVRFPVKGDLCTRFATELVLRKSVDSSVDVSIRFSDPASASQPFKKTGFHRDDLPELIEDAKEHMGIRAGGTKDFSRDVLRVEITGPEVPSLTLVDLPGFFHSETAEQSREGKETVDRLVRSYMAQKNSIILVVVSASAQLANQIVLDEYTKHDPGRTRTLGVITKPDLAPAGSADERKYLQLAQNKEGIHRFTLGWHVLRNRAEQEKDVGDEDRDGQETRFLASGAWGELSPGNKGIASLRRKLSKVLLDHIQKTLPGLISDIEANLEERTTRLDQLGKERATQEDMKSYLIGIAEEFQKLARDGVNGVYSNKFFGELEDRDRKLRAKLRNLNQAFGIVLVSKGASQKICRCGKCEDTEGGGESHDDEDDGVPEYLRPFVSWYDFPNPEVISESDLNEDLEALASVNQGREFPGIPNQDIVVKLFQRQARPWEGISQFHVKLATDLVEDFLAQLVAHVVGLDETTTAAIMRNLVDPFLDEKREVLAAKVQELLRPYVRGYGLPLSTGYQSRMSRRVVRRLADKIGGILEAELPGAFNDISTEGLTARKISVALSRAEELEGGEFGTERIVDTMQVYYEMSRRTFTENVINLAIESCLVSDIEEIITPKKVHLMDAEVVRDLASESPDVAFEREFLQGQIKRLKDGLGVCRRYKPLGATALPKSMPASRSSSANRSKHPSRTTSGVATTRSIPQPDQNGSPSSRGTQPSTRIPTVDITRPPSGQEPATLATGKMANWQPKPYPSPPGTAAAAATSLFSFPPGGLTALTSADKQPAAPTSLFGSSMSAGSQPARRAPSNFESTASAGSQPVQQVSNIFGFPAPGQSSDVFRSHPPIS